MIARSLRRFEPFSRLPPDALMLVAEHARTLRVPAGRWLVRPGRELTGRYYLLRGKVRLLAPDARLAAGSPRSRWPIYPGAEGVFTLSPVVLLRLSAEAAEVSAPTGEVPLPLPQPEWMTDGWECRFLSSAAMERVGLGHCQRVLRAMRPLDLVQGEMVVRQGDPGDTFFVLAAGRAEVARGTRSLAVLEPGDCFGEDAVISGSCRNACVTMTSDGRVMWLPGDLFRDQVVGRVLLDEGDGPAQATLDIGGGAVSGGVSIPLMRLRERLDLLAPQLRYRVVGGSLRQRALGAFVLLHRGFRVALVESGLGAGVLLEVAGDDTKQGKRQHAEQSSKEEAKSACVAGAGEPVYSAGSVHQDGRTRSE